MSAAVEEIERELSYEEERGKPMPSRNHGLVQAELIGQFLQQREYMAISELTLGMQPRPLTPDISIYRRQPVNMSFDVIRPTEPPLMVVEIESPGQGIQELRDKVEAYFAHGVKSCWLVVPTLRNITILTPDGEARFAQGAGVIVDPVTGVSADLSVVFS